MWSFFCHCVIEALLGDFFLSLSPSPPSVLSKGECDCEVLQGLGEGKKGR